MSETPADSTPPNLLEQGIERARARAKIFVKQEPKGDGSVLSVDVKAVVTLEPVSPDTSKDTENEQKIFDAMQAQKESWIQEIRSIKTEKEFSAFDVRVGSENAQHGDKVRASDPPCFTVGHRWRDLLREYSLVTKEAIERSKKQSFVLQKEIDVVYLAKRKEIYQAKKVEDGAKSDTAVVSVQAGMKDTKLVTRGKDIDDKHIQSPFGRSRGNNDAWETQQQEENERAKPVTIEGVISVVDPTVSGAVEKNEEEKISDFVKSIPDGGVILLVSPAGKVNGHYYRDGDDLIRGKEKKQTGIIDTNKVWEKINKPGWTWKIEALLATADTGKAAESENEKKISVELLKLKEKWLEMIRLAQSTEELNANLMKEGFSFTGEDFKDVLKKYTLSSEEEKRAYNKVFDFSKEVKDAKKNRIDALLSSQGINKDIPKNPADPSMSAGEKVSKPDTKIKPVATAVAKKGKGLSPVVEKKPESENETLVSEELLQQKDEWIGRIESVKSPAFLYALAPFVDEKGAKIDFPHFVVGKFLTELFKKHAPLSDKEKKRLEAKALKLQEEIADVYSKKEEGFFAEKPEPKIVVEKLVEPERKHTPAIGIEASITAEASVVETMDANIIRLKKIVEEMRAKYVEEDHKTTSLFNKLKNIFGRNIGENGKGREWQGVYEQALFDLKNAEVERLRLSGKTGEALKKDMEVVSRYFKLDETVNVINERTQYKAKNQTIFGKFKDFFGIMGRAYNRIPLKGKLAMTVAFAGLTFAATISGGTALAAMAFVSVARRFVSGAGVAVGTEVLLEGFGERSRIAKAGKETKEQIETLKIESLGAKPEVSFDAFSTFLEKDIISIDEKLQREKRAKFYRKAGAMGAGIVVGSGWVVNLAMEKLGDSGALDWAKDHIENVPRGPSLVIPISIDQPGDILPGDVPINIPHEPLFDGSVARVEDLFQGGGAYEVKPGDSIWKIIGSRVDGLEGPQKTYFIDALKDKLALLTPEELRSMGIQSGDINELTIGEKIDFSKLTSIDLEQAFEHARDLSPEKIASIAMNDTKIAEYVSTHPGTTLTNESVDRILHGNMMDTGESNGQPLGTEKEPLVFSAQEDSSVGTEEWNMKNASLQYEEDAVLGKTYNMESYRDYFYKNPDTLPQFRKIGESYREFIFQGNQTSINTIGGKMFNELGSLPSEPLEKFVQIARETYGSKLGLPRSTEKVYEYIARMAMIGVENSNGKIMRFPQSV